MTHFASWFVPTLFFLVLHLTNFTSASIALYSSFRLSYPYRPSGACSTWAKCRANRAVTFTFLSLISFSLLVFWWGRSVRHPNNRILIINLKTECDDTIVCKVMECSYNITYSKHVLWCTVRWRKLNRSSLPSRTGVLSPIDFFTLVATNHSLTRTRTVDEENWNATFFSLCTFLLNAQVSRCAARIILVHSDSASSFRYRLDSTSKKYCRLSVQSV